MEIVWHKSTQSTNDDAKRLAYEGALHGTLVGTDHQHQGRGRTGKAWQCKSGEGLMCSLILKPKWEKRYWGWIALSAGLALADLLERDCLDPTIKWPNDILVNGKKMAGILTEADGEVVIVGVGMNLNMPIVPVVESDIQPTSFFIETDCKLDARSYANTVQSTLVALTDVGSPLALRQEVERRLAWRHEMISLQTRTECFIGELLGLGEYGQLLLKVGNDTKEVFDAYNIRKVDL